MEKQMRHATTAQFAEQNLVKPESIRSRYCLTGSYHGVIPIKTLSGRLAWPLSSDEENINDE
jgi:hypothetical protein